MGESAKDVVADAGAQAGAVVKDVAQAAALAQQLVPVIIENKSRERVAPNGTRTQKRKRVGCGFDTNRPPLSKPNHGIPRTWSAADC